LEELLEIWLLVLLLRCSAVDEGGDPKDGERVYLCWDRGRTDECPTRRELALISHESEEY